MFYADRAFVDLAFPAGLSLRIGMERSFLELKEREGKARAQGRHSADLLSLGPAEPILRDSNSTLQDQLTGIRSLQMHQGHRAKHGCGCAASCQLDRLISPNDIPKSLFYYYTMPHFHMIAAYTFSTLLPSNLQVKASILKYQ